MMNRVLSHSNGAMSKSEMVRDAYAHLPAESSPQQAIDYVRDKYATRVSYATALNVKRDLKVKELVDSTILDYEQAAITPIDIAPFSDAPVVPQEHQPVPAVAVQQPILDAVRKAKQIKELRRELDDLVGGNDKAEELLKLL